ncbi:6296_t:CDS:2, partial [Racocetra persica]
PTHPSTSDPLLDKTFMQKILNLEHDLSEIYNQATDQICENQQKKKIANDDKIIISNDFMIGNKMPTDVSLFINDLLTSQPMNITPVPSPYTKSDPIETKINLTYRAMLQSTQ